MKEVKPKLLKKLMKFLAFLRRNQDGFCWNTGLNL